MATNSNFESFFHGWLSRQEEFLHQLESLLSPIDGFDRNRECSDIIPRVFSHYEEFYREKTIAASHDVFQIISPPWLSSFERSLLWISGFRPSMLFPIIDFSDLSIEQKEKIEEVKSEARRVEREITQAMARIQETVAEQPVYSLMRKFGGLVDGEECGLVGAMEELKAAMLVVVGNADALQGWTVAEVVQVMDPVQGVKLFAALARFQLQARRWGVQSDLERESTASAADEAHS